MAPTLVLPLAERNRESSGGSGDRSGYDSKRGKGDEARAALRAITALACFAVPGTALAGSLSGTVRDDATQVGIGGVVVCPTPQPYEFEVACVQTDASGHYTFQGLLEAS